MLESSFVGTSGVERTQKFCVESSIGYVGWDQDWVDFTAACWINPSIPSGLFKGICRVVANWMIGQHFSELWHHEDCAHKKMALLIWNKQLSLISGPCHSIALGISGRVLRTYSCLAQIIFQNFVNFQLYLEISSCWIIEVHIFCMWLTSIYALRVILWQFSKPLNMDMKGVVSSHFWYSITQNR